MDHVVSIVTPTYNRAPLLRTAIQSVIAQTYPHWELLIIDDASTDDTASMLASLNEPRIRYEKVPHGGASRARNHGLGIAEGKWITFLDSDDEFLPTFLERTVETFAQNPSVSCVIPKGRKIHELW